MDSRDPERVGPLDAFRLELVRRIAELIAAVGPEPSAPPALSPMPELARTSTDALAADASVPALVRAAACVKADRYELAIPLYAAVRSDASAAADDRLAALREETKLRMELLDRAGALGALDSLLADAAIPAERKDGLELRRMELMLTPVKFRERFTARQIAAAEKALGRLKVRGISADRRFSLAWNLAKVMLNSDDPAAAFAYDEKYGKANGFDEAQCGRLLYCTVEACRRLGGRDREAYKALKRVIELGGADLNGEDRNLCGEAGVYAESFGDHTAAQQFYAKSLSAWPKDNDKWYPLWKESLRRVTKKVSATIRASDAIKTEEPAISLDED